jgi:GTP-binding protein EngB required for normal cell division
VTSVVNRVMEAFRGGGTGVDADALIRRVDALQRFLHAGDGYLPEERLVGARTLVERATQRLALSRHHTVIALAGATGSGKSSLFNALARLELSPVGVRRPTTGVTYSCVWGPPGTATGLLDWLGVLPRHRFNRESALDADDEARLRGLVLLDLPDFDSIEGSHRAEVDRLLALVDLVVWVLDPQKYADKLVHESYLRQFHRHKEVTFVALNHADRLTHADVQRCLDDLTKLLDVDGLAGVPALATSAYAAPGWMELRKMLEGVVAAKQAALHRLSGDVERAVEELSDVTGPAPAAKNAVDPKSARELVESLGQAAGVPAVVEATERAYRHRAGATMGWPLLRWLRRLRPDPLRRLHLPGRTTGGPVPATSLPAPTAAQRASVGLAVRTMADEAAAGMPVPWQNAVVVAARSRLDDMPDALDRAVATTDLGLTRTPWWWRLVGGIQWLVTIASIVGLGWLLVGYAIRATGLPPIEYPRVGAAPLPTVLLVGGLLVGVILAGLAGPLAAAAARRARARAESRLRAAVTEIADEFVVMPSTAVVHGYGEARAALVEARG